MIELNCPLVSIDLETTGTFVELDRIVQMGIVKLVPDGDGRVTRTEWEALFDPTIPIPPEATAVHGITDEMVRGQPTFASRAHGLREALKGCDYLGYNLARFDLRMLDAEFRRANVYQALPGRVIDVYKIVRKYKPHTLEHEVRTTCGREPTDAHRALGDAIDALEVFERYHETHAELPRTVEGLYTLFFETPEPGFLDPERRFAWRADEAIINFGKHAGVRLRDVPRSYLRWMLDGDWDRFTKSIVRDALAGKFPVPPVDKV